MDIASIIISGLSILGSIASIWGIWLTYKQVKATKEETEATKRIAEAAKEAVEKTQKSIHKTISTVDITKHCESIKRIQDVLEGLDNRFALHLCEELKEALMEIEKVQKKVLKKEKPTLSDFILQLGIDIESIRLALSERDNHLDKGMVISNLEKLRDEMLNIKIDYKTDIE